MATQQQLDDLSVEFYKVHTDAAKGTINENERSSRTSDIMKRANNCGLSPNKILSHVQMNQAQYAQAMAKQEA